MKRFNINTKKVYQKNGEEKAQWNTVGQLVFFPATDDKESGFALELHMFPQTKFYIFEQKSREAQKSPTTENVDVDNDLPF